MTGTRSVPPRLQSVLVFHESPGARQQAARMIHIGCVSPLISHYTLIFYSGCVIHYTVSYRYQLCLDQECKEVLDKIPQKKKSLFVRDAIKAYKNGSQLTPGPRKSGQAHNIRELPE